MIPFIMKKKVIGRKVKVLYAEEEKEKTLTKVFEEGMNTWKAASSPGLEKTML